MRISTKLLSLTFAGFVALAGYESYTTEAVIPVAGDVPTIGFGTTEGVKLGDKITPPVALQKAHRDITRVEGAVGQCVHVPLHQYEYDAAIQLSYNIGTSAFCGSTVVKRWNAGDYTGGCDAFLMWDKMHGKQVKGLTNRRIKERESCLGH